MFLSMGRHPAPASLVCNHGECAVFFPLVPFHIRDCHILYHMFWRPFTISLWSSRIRRVRDVLRCGGIFLRHRCHELPLLKRRHPLPLLDTQWAKRCDSAHGGRAWFASKPLAQILSIGNFPSISLVCPPSPKNLLMQGGNYSSY